MAVSARGQITITDMRNEGTYTFLRYSDDGGKTFSPASQAAQDDIQAGMPVEGRNLWDCSLMQRFGNSTTINVLNASTNTFSMTLNSSLRWARIRNIFRWGDKSWGDKPYVLSGYVKADKPVRIRFELNDNQMNASPIDLGTEYQFFSVSWKSVTSKYFADNNYFGLFCIATGGKVEENVTFTFTFDKLKLEVGDKASAFTPTNLVGIENAEKNSIYGRNLVVGTNVSKTISSRNIHNEISQLYIYSHAILANKNDRPFFISADVEFRNCTFDPIKSYVVFQSNNSNYFFSPRPELGRGKELENKTYHLRTAFKSDNWKLSDRLPTFDIRRDYINGGTITISNVKVETVDSVDSTGTPWSPAPEDCIFGTTRGKYLGTLVWEKPSPSDDPKDYVWARIEGENGADAEKYELSVVEESALIERTRTSSTPLAYSDKLTISLKYKILHVKGDTSTVVPASDTGYQIRVRGNNGLPEQSKFSAGNTPTYALTINNYSGLSSAQKSTQLIVELLYKNAVIEKRLVPVLLKADSWLEQDAQHIALINRQAQQIASIKLDADGITQRVESMRNGVRNLTRGRFDVTWSSGAAMSNFIPVTLEPSTTYTITMCAEMSDALAVRQGAVIQLSLSSADNAFSVKLNLRGKGKQKVWATFNTGKVAGFPADGKLYYRVYMGGGDGVSTATLYWVTLTPGTIPAEDYYEDVQTMITDGRVVISGETRIDGMFFSKKAKVGGGVFYGKYIYSAQGSGTKAGESDAYKNFNKDNPYEDQQWRPKMVIDTETGEAMFADGKVRLRPDGSGYLAGGGIQWDKDGKARFAGQLRGVTGSFETLKCVDDHGRETGEISFYGSGISFNFADIFHFGQVNGRKVRFYIQQLLCGSFGSLERNTIVVTGASSIQYMYGFSKSDGFVHPLDASFTPAGEKFYKIVCNETSANFPIFPVDVIIFSITDGSVYNYELVMSDTQRVMLVNANDRADNVRIYSNGHSIVWNAGLVGEVIKVPTNRMNPTPGDKVVGAGILVSGTNKNNW